MIDLLSLFLALLAAPFKSRMRLEAENVVVVSENCIQADWRNGAESAHDPVQCVSSSSSFGPWSPISSSRGESSKLRTYFCDISSILL